MKPRRRRKVTVVELKPKTVVVDGNHPLAGKTLEIEVQLLVRDFASGRKTKRDLGGEA